MPDRTACFGAFVVSGHNFPVICRALCKPGLLIRRTFSGLDFSGKIVRCGSEINIIDYDIPRVGIATDPAQRYSGGLSILHNRHTHGTVGRIRAFGYKRRAVGGGCIDAVALTIQPGCGVDMGADVITVKARAVDISPPVVGGLHGGSPGVVDTVVPVSQEIIVGY